MSERSAVQNPMLKYAQQIGWEYVRPDDALALRGFAAHSTPEDITERGEARPSTVVFF